MRKSEYRIRVERDPIEEGAWRVTEYRRNKPQTVLFTGDLAEAHDYAQEMVQFNNTVTSELDF